MRRRKLWVVAGLAVLVAVGAVVPSSGTWPDRITRENYKRIMKGMSRAEVIAILGPLGDSSSGPTEIYGDVECVSWNPPTDVRARHSIDALLWRTDVTEIQVWISESGAYRKEFSETRAQPGSTFEQKLRWRAKRQWRRWLPEK